MTNIPNEYRNLLTTAFSKLDQKIQTYLNSVDTGAMVQAAIIKCRSEMEIFCLEKLAKLLINWEMKDLAAVVLKLTEFYK
jgi:hypothetical protein